MPGTGSGRLVLKVGRVVEQGAVDSVLDQPQAAYTQTLLEHWCL